MNTVFKSSFEKLVNEKVLDQSVVDAILNDIAKKNAPALEVHFDKILKLMEITDKCHRELGDVLLAISKAELVNSPVAVNPANQPTAKTPFYKSWKFWSVILSCAAIIGASGYIVARNEGWFDKTDENGHVTE